MIRNLNEIKYENQSSRFLIKHKEFKYQYAPLYAERLCKMRIDISEAAKKKWSSKYAVKSLVDLVQNEKCIIIGTLYKEMKNKPNILKELAEHENDSLPMQPVLDRDAKYIDTETDQLILEDELQRILLVDAPQKNIIGSNRFCTGIVIGLLGAENEDSAFQVEDYCFKHIEFQYSPAKLPKQIDTRKTDNYVVFLSGIELGDNANKASDYLYKLQLMFDYLRGDFVNESSDDEELMMTMVRKTLRLVIVGNSLASSTQSKDMLNKAKYLTKNYIAGSVNAIKMLDEYLNQLVSSVY